MNNDFVHYAGHDAERQEIEEVMACKRLCVNVIKQAIKDRQFEYQAAQGKEPNCFEIRDTEMFRDRANAWFQSVFTGEGSFIWYCKLLDWDADSVRKRVLAGIDPALLSLEGEDI